MKRSLVLTLVFFLVAVIASPEEPSREALAGAVARLDVLLATAVATQTTPPILSDDEAVNSPSGDISLTGTISRAGVPFNLSRFGAQYRGFKGRTAILRTGSNTAITVTCLVDLLPCAEKTEGMWTLTPTYDSASAVIRWTVSRYSPLTLKLLR